MNGELTKRSETMTNLIEKIIGAVAAVALLMAVAVSPGFAQEGPSGSSADEDDAPILVPPPGDEDGDAAPTIPNPPNLTRGCFLCQFLGSPPNGEGVNLDSVEYFIRRYRGEEGERLDFDINGREFALTALHLAARYKTQQHYEIAELLLQQPEVDVNIRDHFERTPLHYATRSRNMKVLTLMVAHDRTNLNPTELSNDNTPISLAFERGTPEDYDILRIFANSDRVPTDAFPNPPHVIRYALKNNLDDFAKTVNGESVHSMYGGKPLIFHAVSQEDLGLVSAILADSEGYVCESKRKFEWANPVAYAQDLDNPAKYGDIISVLEEHPLCERDIDPEYCHNKDEGDVKYVELNEQCIKCRPHMDRENNECKETLESCNAINKIFKDGNGMCESCPPNSTRDGNECIPEICGNVESQRQLYRAHADAVCACSPDSERHVPGGQNICECREQNHEWINEQYNCVEKPLVWSAWDAMDMDLFNLLIDNTLNISVDFGAIRNGRNVLYSAIYRIPDSSSWVSALIRGGVRPDFPVAPHSNYTAIHRLSGGTSALGRDYTFSLLSQILSASQYTNIAIDAVTSTRNGETALHLAAYKGWTEHAELLLDKGADCHRPLQNSRWKALDIAYRENHSGMINLLNNHENCSTGAGGASGQSEETAPPKEQPPEFIIPPEEY